MAAAAKRFGSTRHLAGRFWGALSPAGPPADDERWAREQLLPGEVDLWRRMSGPDRRHAVAVARRSAELLGGQPARAVLAAALLHDVGKVEARLGTFSRVAATAAAPLIARSRAGGWPERARRYLEHDRIGGELLRAAGSDPLTAAWAEQHHLPPERWAVERRVGDALKSADGS